MESTATLGVLNSTLLGDLHRVKSDLSNTSNSSLTSGTILRVYYSDRILTTGISRRAAAFIRVCVPGAMPQSPARLPRARPPAETLRPEFENLTKCIPKTDIP